MNIVLLWRDITSLLKGCRLLKVIASTYRSVLWIRIRILPLSRKSDKNLDFYCFVTFFYDFLSLKTDANIPSRSNEQRKLWKNLIFCCHLESLKSVVRIHNTGTDTTRWYRTYKINNQARIILHWSPRYCIHSTVCMRKFNCWQIFFLLSKAD